jgi:biotin operon repressor
MQTNVRPRSDPGSSKQESRAAGNAVAAASRLFDAVGDSRGKAAFAARALDAITQLTERTDEGALIDAAGAPTSFSALLQALDNPEALSDVRRIDPLAPARLRGLRVQEWVLSAEGGTLSAAQIGRALGISRQAVDKRRKHGHLIGIDTGRHGYAYPVWQVDSQGTLDGLSDVLAELHDESPWGQATFFLTASDWLDGDTPLAALRRGEIEHVVIAAHAMGEQITV